MTVPFVIRANDLKVIELGFGEYVMENKYREVCC